MSDLSELGTSVPLPRSGEPGMPPEISAPHLDDLGVATRSMGTPRELRLLADIPVEVSVELGRLRMPLRDLLALEPGAVLELDRAADAPVDVLINGRLVARGEVVVIDGEFGVRVTDVVDEDTR
jgi:flagellar motor switch protein FliN/FliY